VPIADSKKLLHVQSCQLRFSSVLGENYLFGFWQTDFLVGLKELFLHRALINIIVDFPKTSLTLLKTQIKPPSIYVIFFGEKERPVVLPPPVPDTPSILIAQQFLKFSFLGSGLGE